MSLENLVKEFNTHFSSAISEIEAAARCYAEACRKYPDTAQSAFEKIRPQVSPCTWDKLRAIGNGDLNANVLFLSKPTAICQCNTRCVA